MDPYHELIGHAPGIEAVRQQIGRLLKRQSDARRLPPVLIQGETGTGKGLLARMIHRMSPRGGGAFMDVNCAAIPETLLEAELFGFERGAFTDARQAKPGLFQAAHHGTIFLDEVGLLPEGVQAKLLKVIEEQSVRRLGSTRSEPVDVWILTATNADLVALTKERRFREDLYHRLAVLTLTLPPLRERGRDIIVLAEHFLERACADYGLAPKAFAPETRAALLAHPWPGNIRELSNVMERVALLSESPVVTAEALALPGPERPAVAPVAGRGAAGSLAEAVGSVERARLLETLEQTGWNISHAAARLGLTRNTLRYRIEKHGLRAGAPATPAAREPRRARPPVSPPAAAAAVAAVPAPAPSASGIRWERRRLTLLRADLVLPGSHQPGPAMTRLLEILIEKVRTFGGRVEEMRPTGVVAAFGLDPVEDAPRRAVHAAMAMHKARERVLATGEGEVRVPVGIHVGLFLVGQARGAAAIATDDKRAAWEALEALVSSAEGDGIFLSETAVSFLARRFDLVPTSGTLPGGRPIYRLAGLEPADLGPGRRMARFVGRRYDLELLQNRLASAVSGRGQAVGIVGEAGIGKSRLLYEFRQALDPQAVTYIEGACLSYGAAVPYLPLLGVLRQNFGLSEGDSPEAITEKVSAVLRLLEMAREEWAPYIFHLLGVREGTESLRDLGAQKIQARTLETLRQMCLRSSRQRPLVVAVEDLHWVDRTSEEALSTLVEILPGTRILFVATYRPGYRPPWMDRSYATQMALQPLSDADGLAVVQSVLQRQDLPDPVARLILGKAEGNPFFLEELTRAVAEEGELTAALTVPDTIHDVLLARIERLPEAAKRLLQTASVVGRDVSLRLLRAIWDEPESLDSQLSDLRRLEFVHERPDSGEAVYVFKHTFTQEVAYESLVALRREELHRACGRALEALYAGRLEEVYDRLAHHYARTDDAAKAVEYLSRFAAKAARGHAHTEAVGALEVALGHVARVPEAARERQRIELVLRQASSLIPLGRVQDVLELLRREEDSIERLDDPTLGGQYFFLLGRVYSFLGEHERAAQSAQRAIAQAQRSGDEATVGKAYYLLALEGPLSGQPLQGIEDGQQAVLHLERSGEGWGLGPAHWLVGLNYAVVGEFEKALAAQSRAQAIGEAIGDLRLQTFAAWGTGIIHAAAGEGDLGVEACRRSAERSPDPLNTAIAEAWLGFAHLEKGDAAGARPLLARAVEQIAQFEFRPLRGWFTAFLAEACLATGEIERARALAEQAVGLTRDARFVYGCGWARRTLGRIAMAQGAHEEAGRHLDEARATFESLHARYDVARTGLDLAALAHARGADEEAARHLSDAHRRFSALGVARYVDRAERLASELGVAVGGR